MSCELLETAQLYDFQHFLTAMGAKIYAKFTRKINYQSLEMVLLYDFRHSTIFLVFRLSSICLSSKNYKLNKILTAFPPKPTAFTIIFFNGFFWICASANGTPMN